MRKSKVKKQPSPRKYILCKVKDDDFIAIIYRDGTWRYSNWHKDEQSYEWDIAHSAKAGPIFLYRKSPDHEWETYWHGGDEYEKRLAKIIVEALNNLEVENILKDKA